MTQQIFSQQKDCKGCGKPLFEGQSAGVGIIGGNHAGLYHVGCAPALDQPTSDERVEIVAKALMMFDRDKHREHDVFGYRILMYGDPPAEWDALCDFAKDQFREQAKVAIGALSQSGYGG